MRLERSALGPRATITTAPGAPATELPHPASARRGEKVPVQLHGLIGHPPVIARDAHCPTANSSESTAG